MRLMLDVGAMTEENRIFFCDMLPYVSTHVKKVVRAGDSIHILLEDQYLAEVEEKCGKLKEMMEGGRLSGKELDIQTLEDHTDRATANTERVFPKLLASGAVKELAGGAYAYSGIFLKVYQYFIKKIDSFGFETFEDIREFEFPALYPIRDYEKGKYFETFPHYIMFQTEMKNDLEVLDRFARKGTSDPAIFQEMKTPVNVLRHAACAPIYGMLSGQRILPDRPLTFLVSGKCYRNEAQNVFELARLMEFLMKEYVFVGTSEQCLNQVERAKGLWRFWIDTFGLNCKVDSANDSFFASNYKKLKLFQLMGNSKQEFKWYIPGTESFVACSSANFHRTHFSKPYRIKNDAGTFCHTACFAFGVERLAYSLLNQKGDEPSGWDQATYEEIAKYVSL